jgi:hypothetical protein
MVCLKQLSSKAGVEAWPAAASSAGGDGGSGLIDRIDH